MNSDESEAVHSVPYLKVMACVYLFFFVYTVVNKHFMIDGYSIFFLKKFKIS